jgi:hypothetical protein
MNNKMEKIIFFLFIISIHLFSFAKPIPGDIFRDYVWTTPKESGYAFLCVIGDGDYREPVNFAKVYPEECIEDGWVVFDKNVDLRKAVKAKLQVEVLLSHDETSGFAVKN